MKTKKISELKLAEYNPRKISDEEMEKIKTSLKEFGFLQMVWTDPPYNVDYESSRIGKIKNDKMSAGNFSEFMEQVFNGLAQFMRKGAVSYISKANDIVLDIFAGSGSALIACEKMGRVGRMMELDPIFVDKIINRWERLTGKKAKLINK